MPDRDHFNYQKIDPKQLTKWRNAMGYSARYACEALGCSRGAWEGWENGTHTIPAYIGLAMAALGLDMRPYGEKPAKSKKKS